MSLARTALRLSVVEALGADPTIGAMCQGRIYDSRIGDMTSLEAVPVITVYTEDDAGTAYSTNNGGPPFDEACELLLEIAMRATVPTETDEKLIGLVESDRQLESMIDLLEQRAIEAVTIANTPQSALVRSVTRRVTAFKSMRFVSDETSAKLAIRMLHLTAHLKAFDDDDPRSPPTGPFALLPEPLRTVAAAMPAGSSGRDTCTKLATAMIGDRAPIEFSGLDIETVPALELRASLDGSRPHGRHPDRL